MFKKIISFYPLNSEIFHRKIRKSWIDVRDREGWREERSAWIILMISLNRITFWLSWRRVSSYGFRFFRIDCCQDDRRFFWQHQVSQSWRWKDIDLFWFWIWWLSYSFWWRWLNDRTDTSFSGFGLGIFGLVRLDHF